MQTPKGKLHGSASKYRVSAGKKKFWIFKFSSILNLKENLKKLDRYHQVDVIYGSLLLPIFHWVSPSLQELDAGKYDCVVLSVQKVRRMVTAMAGTRGHN